MKISWKVTQVTSSLTNVVVAQAGPQEVVVWNLTYQAVVNQSRPNESGVLGGSLNLRYTSDPGLKVGDVLATPLPA